VRRKVRLDLVYVRRMCAWLDARILLATMRKFFGDSQTR
jgi:lipopolysaccharide/colanic/teichoic acid biosynthesis glycosyltransferase